MDTGKLLELLHSQVIPAIGCTEPVSVAIAVATAKQHITKEINNVEVSMSLNIFKNGMHVGIPGTTQKGLYAAIALSLAIEEPTLDLEIFKDVDEQIILNAQRFLDAKIIHVNAIQNHAEFFIKVIIHSSTEIAECVIEANHTNIISVKKNGVELLDSITSESEKNSATNETISTLEEIYSFIEAVDPLDVAFLLSGADMNLRIAEVGKTERYSSGLGVRLFSLMEKGLLTNDISNVIKAYTAAACDARMGGVNLPVMSSSGSGNQGIVATIPVALLARHLQVSDEKLTLALALSHLITNYIKQQTGRLSPVCGCAVAAGIGSTVALTYLQDGTPKQMNMAINNMVGTLAGMVCDGAKGGCSYKLATAATEAYLQSLVVFDQTSVSDNDGIIGDTTEQTLTNLGLLCKKGMKSVDETLVAILSK
ncbi:MAG: serine dehydratase subunit alpha family protein [Spirochaetia bacterium]|nr:serine dehydratase subunit alpha family protein [Spirochaetia bacterium]